MCKDWGSVSESQKHSNCPSLKTFRNEIFIQGFECTTSFPELSNFKRTSEPFKYNTLYKVPKQLQGQMKKSAEGKDHQVLEELNTNAVSHVFDNF